MRFSKAFLAKILTLLAFWGALLSTSVALGKNSCESRHCPQGLAPIEVCFVHPQVYKDSLWRLSLSATCRSAHEVHLISNRADLHTQLDRINHQCKVISKASFHGHGTEESQQMGDLHFDSSMDDLKQFACAFEPHLHVHLNGCNNGKSCYSDILMLKLSRTLFHQGVRLTAPSSYATTFLPGIMPHTSINFKNRKLLFVPSGQPSDIWMQEGLTRDNGGSIADRCGSEVETSIESLKRALKLADKNNCRHLFDVSHEKMQKIEEYARLIKNPNFYDNLTEEKIKDLRDLKKYIQRATDFLSTCRSYELSK